MLDGIRVGLQELCGKVTLDRVTLAQRLLVAIGILTVATTAAFGFGVREAWRRSEEERFRTQFLQATASLKRQIQREVRDLPTQMAALCRHDPTVDSALVGLKGNDLDARRLSLSLRVPELMKAMRLSELTMVTHRGEILGTGHNTGEVGRRDPELARSVKSTARAARLRKQPPPLAVETACLHEDSRRAGLWVGLYAARHLEPLLEETAKNHALKLALRAPPSSPELMTQSLELSELGGLQVWAYQSRTRLFDALQRLDTTVLILGASSIGLALFVAMLLARGLARPIVELSRQAREVVAGDPKPVEPRGGRELRELATAFNRAISDLAQMRKRLAATERIAARREIARRVAHEIKNPLLPIRAAVETLRRLRARDDPAFDDYFDEASRTVLEEVARISNIVTEFTRFARLPAPNPQPFDPTETVRSVVHLHQGSGAELHLESGPAHLLNADRDQLVQVITNLLQNAIDAARSNARPQVWVKHELRDGVFELTVEDNGPGVTPEMRKRLFEPYATNKPHGTGLGLAIVQRIVIEHGGDIRYQDAVRGGACFVVRLPLEGPSPLSEAPPSKALG